MHIHISIVNFDPVDVNRVWVCYSVLSGLISTPHMNLRLLQLHAVVAKVQLIHVVSAEALALFYVLYRHFVTVLQI